MSKVKTFSLNFRYRTSANELLDKWENVEADSKAKATAYGKSVAVERAASYGGKYWFMRCEVYSAKSP